MTSAAFRTSSLNPEAILYDKRDSALLYVFSPQGESGKGKRVVRVDYRTEPKNQRNEMRTGGFIEAYNLRNPRYSHILGEKP
ncbi:MAG: hypothetical protein ACYYK0_03480 [Candidatus Eutrophobiaceae bacterium]